MATPTRLSVSNVALPNTADSGSVSITIPTGANACRIAGTYYVTDSSVPTSVTGSAFAATTNGALRVNNPSSGSYMGHFSVLFKVTATGSQTIRVQKTGGYSEGPTCQIIWYTVDDPDNFVPTGGHLVAQPTAVPQALALTVNSNTTDLVDGLFGTDGSSADPSAPTGTTQQGTMQTTQFDKQIAFSVNSPGASTTTVTAGSRDYPALSLASLRGSSGGTGYVLEITPGSYALTGSSAATLAGRLSSVTPGSYAISGSSARTNYNRVASVTPGSYDLTGSSAALVLTRSLNVTPGSYSITGSDGVLSAGLLVNVTPGSYAVSGADVELVYTPASPALEINVTPGSYGFTGADGTLLKSSVLNVTPGVYSLSGANAGLFVGKVLSVDPGAYVLTGTSAALLGSKVLGVDPGAYSVTGSNVELEYVTPNKELAVTPGAYLFTGYPVELVYSGEAGPGRSAGFVLVDHEPKSWWKRKPKAVPVAVAEKRIKRVAKAIDEIAAEKIEQDEPINQREVRAEIAPLLAEMPGFDFRPLFKAIVEFRQSEAARLEAIAQIERIRAIEQDDEDVLILLMSF